MSGQKKNYDKYLKSLAETPGPVRPKEDWVIDVNLLFDYLHKTGKKAKELTVEEYEPFWVRREKEKVV